MGFNIKHGYVENPVAYFLDDPKPAADDPSATITFQPDVYTFAETIAALLSDGGDNGVTVYDVGCGWADKLAAMNASSPRNYYVGIDYGANIEHCKETYGPQEDGSGDWGDWIESDLEVGLPKLPVLTERKVIICSDVIEHLDNPSPLLRDLASIDGAIVIISTPERDIQHGYAHMGPSPNLCHVREWNAEELHGYLASCGLKLLHHGMTRGNNRDWVMATQLVVCVS